MLTNERLEQLQRQLYGKKEAPEKEENRLELTVHISCQKSILEAILEKKCTSLTLAIQESAQAEDMD